MIIFYNGDYMNADDAKVSIFDHGLLYGDGVFEGIRIYGGKVFKLREHVERLFASAHAFLIPLEQHYTPDQFNEHVLETVRRNELEDGYIRVTVTRGVGLGLDPKSFEGREPTVIISASTLSLYPRSCYEEGMEVVTVALRLPRPDAIDPRIKSTGKYINNIWAKFLANQYGADEGLMLTADGYVAEATGDNIFIIEKGRLYTPPVYIGILPGITRQAVMDLAREQGMEVEERMMTLFDVYNADEALLTGTAAEVVPMVKLDGRTLGDGTPGPVTKRLIERFHQYTREVGIPL
ncbi:MAG: branched-chain-amino-acid transaminase [Armatimonadetes bacterium]|nr:branched-chain-amino-acid transaminase [Armatimonadota bacterium]